MIIEYYPEDIGDQDAARIKKFVQKGLSKRRDLKLLVEKFLKKVEESSTLQPFLDSGQISTLELVHMNYGREKTRLYEMRIPPKRSGGVVRIYFIQCKDDDKRILLLDGEIKHKKASAIKDNMSNLTRTLNY